VKPVRRLSILWGAAIAVSSTCGEVKRIEEGSGSQTRSGEREHLRGENVMRVRLVGCGSVYAVVVFLQPAMRRG